jgi:hypothetical protein
MIEEEKDDLMDSLSEWKEDDVSWAQDEPVVVEETATDTEATETTTETETITATETTTATADWISELNKSFGANYSTVDELKSVFDEYSTLKEKTSKISNFDAISQRVEKLEKEKELLIEKYREKSDPKSLFANDIEYKRNQLMKINPSVNGEVAKKAFDIDLSTANPLDVIALNMQLTSSKIAGGEVGAKETFLLKNGIDVEMGSDGSIDLSELSRAQTNLINIEAEEAAKNIAKLRDSVQMPEQPKEIEALISEWMESKREPEFDMKQWDGAVESVVKGVDVFEVKDGDTVLYSEPVDLEFKKGLDAVIRETILKGKLANTKENVEAMKEEIKKAYAVENMTEIMKRFKSATELKIKEAVHNKLHNDTDPDKGHQASKPSSGYTTPLNKVLGIR